MAGLSSFRSKKYYAQSTTEECNTYYFLRGTENVPFRFKKFLRPSQLSYNNNLDTFGILSSSSII